MLYLLGALAWPALAPRALGTGALFVSVGLELFQLTGIPARLARGHGGMRELVHLVVGTTFEWHDIACYVLGASAITALDQWTRPRPSRRQ